MRDQGVGVVESTQTTNGGALIIRTMVRSGFISWYSSNSQISQPVPEFPGPGLCSFLVQLISTVTPLTFYSLSAHRTLECLLPE